MLTQAYRQAALKAAANPMSRVDPEDMRIPSSEIRRGNNYVKLIERTPLFIKIPHWQIQASMTEAFYFRPLLRSRRLSVFPRTGMAP